MATPHDSFFKAVFSRPSEATGVLKAVLPPALVDQLDLSSAKEVRGSFVDSHLTWRYSDLLYTVKLLDREAFVYVLWEAQVSQDPLMPLRLLIYMGRIWEDWLKKEEARRKEAQDFSAIKKVPPILPVVLYPGPKPWAAPTNPLQVIDLPQDLLAAVRDHLPSFEFVLDDLSQQDDEALRRREAGPLGKLALLLLRHARDEREEFLIFLRTMRGLVSALGDRDDQVMAFSYILSVSEVESAEIEAALGPEVTEVVVTAAERLRAEGKVEGRVEGRRESLLRLLRLKFGRALTQEVETQVSQATASDLDTWLDRFVVATTLDAVFSPE